MAFLVDKPLSPKHIQGHEHSFMTGYKDNDSNTKTYAVDITVKLK